MLSLNMLNTLLNMSKVLNTLLNMLNSTLFAQAVIEGEPGAHSLLLLLFILVLQLKRGRGGHEVLIFNMLNSTLFTETVNCPTVCAKDTLLSTVCAKCTLFGDYLVTQRGMRNEEEDSYSLINAHYLVMGTLLGHFGGFVLSEVDTMYSAGHTR